MSRKCLVELQNTGPITSSRPGSGGDSTLGGTLTLTLTLALTLTLTLTSLAERSKKSGEVSSGRGEGEKTSSLTVTPPGGSVRWAGGKQEENK